MRSNGLRWVRDWVLDALFVLSLLMIVTIGAMKFYWTSGPKTKTRSR